jgi:hypothetical protein
MLWDTASDLRAFCAGSSSCEEARAAVNRAPLRWIERNSCLLSTLGALYGNFDSLSHSRRLRGSNSCQPFILGLLARLASLRLVFQALIMKENLFSRSPNKVLGTIHASDWAILILTLVTHFQCGSRFHLCHVLLPWVRLTSNDQFRRANKEERVKERTRFGLFTTEAEGPASRAAALFNLYITMAKLCQGKSGIKLPDLDIPFARMGASPILQ